jgi:putative heme-binding domain-containing protein
VPQSVPVLLNLLRSPSSAIQKAALQALTRYSDPDIGKRICEAYQNSLTDENGQREAAQRVLASRPEWTSQFLAEIEQFRIRSTSVPPEIIQQLRLHQDPALQERVNKLFGRTRAAPEEKLQDMQRWRKFIASSRGPKAAVHPDAGAGRALFKQHCGQCHTLFGEGGAVGPNLTGYERSNLDFLILAVVDPSAAIREEFTQYQIVTTDGRVLTGLIVDQTPTTVSLRAANGQTSVLARGEIDVLQATPISLMPEGLLPKMTEQQVADLFAYLMQPTPGVTPAAAN